MIDVFVFNRFAHVDPNLIILYRATATTWRLQTAKKAIHSGNENTIRFRSGASDLRFGKLFFIRNANNLDKKP